MEPAQAIKMVARAHQTMAWERTGRSASRCRSFSHRAIRTWRSSMFGVARPR
ncbi:hypothetical protein ACFQQB_60185 [Nonomuraea rubra]|uniref:hypothetical protein n=1 Tax=Nonomuraea rubra TaxID=46180 RepID=UPI003606CC10